MMTPERYVETLRQQPAIPLRSAILYGSAAAGDHAGAGSDYNLLLILNSVDRRVLDALLKPTRGWLRSGNPPPLLFTREQLARSADVFPIELLDMLDSHRILFGEDILAGLAVGTEHLRLQVEHELKGKLIQLRKQYLAVGTRSSAVVALVVESYSSVATLLRAALRLFSKTVPASKIEAVRALSQHLAIPVEVFETIERLKRNRTARRHADGPSLFDPYVAAIEAAVNAVDAFVRGKN